MSKYQTFKNEAKSITKDGINYADKINFATLFKVIAVVLVLIISFISGKGIITKLKSLFGLDTSVVKAPEGWNASTGASTNLLFNNGNSSGATGVPIDPKDNKSNSNNKPWRPIVDSIWNKCGGYNWNGAFPEVVNKIAHLSDDYAKKAAYYWDATYKDGVGMGLYKFIYEEHNSGEFYQPALGKLKKLGFKY